MKCLDSTQTGCGKNGCHSVGHGVRNVLSNDHPFLLLWIHVSCDNANTGAIQHQTFSILWRQVYCKWSSNCGRKVSCSARFFFVFPTLFFLLVNHQPLTPFCEQKKKKKERIRRQREGGFASNFSKNKLTDRHPLLSNSETHLDSRGSSYTVKSFSSSSFRLASSNFLLDKMRVHSEPALLSTSSTGTLERLRSASSIPDISTLSVNNSNHDHNDQPNTFSSKISSLWGKLRVSALLRSSTFWKLTFLFFVFVFCFS